MKILMLGWELPPNNSGGLGVACYELCKSLAKKGVDIEFLLPYKAEHNIDFMTVTAAHPQGVAEVLKAGIAYDSYKYIFSDGHSEWIDIHGQQELYEHAVDSMVCATGQEYDVVHAHDWLTFRAGLRVKQRKGWPLIVHIHSVEADRAGREFGGNPLVCSAASAVLHVIERDGLVGHAAEMGELLHGSLQDLHAKDVRGLGLMQAFEFEEPKAKPFQQACLEAGLIVNAVDDNSVRLVPPLIISADQIDRAHAVMQKAVR